MRSPTLAAGVLALALGLLSSAPGRAQPAAEFFKGRTITLLVGGTAGGGIDIPARIFARHASRYIPGAPTIVPQLMPGAGGIRVVDTLATAAPRDGTTIAAIPSGPLVEPLVGGRSLNYKMTDLLALGAWSKDVSLCLAWHTSGFATIDDAKARAMTVAGAGAASSTDTFPLALNAALGTKFHVITGYLGTQETIVAIERGETHGRCGWSWSSFKSIKYDWLREKKVNVLLTMGSEKSPLLPDVPLARDLAPSPESRQMLDLMFSPLALTNAFLAPPGLPADRAAMLRQAFVDALKDDELIKEATRTMGDAPSPTSGEEMQRQIDRMYSTPQPIVSMLRDALKK